MLCYVFFVMVKEVNFNFKSHSTLMTHKWPKQNQDLNNVFFLFIGFFKTFMFFFLNINSVVISSKMVALPLGIMFLDTKLTVCLIFSCPEQL